LEAVRLGFAPWTGEIRRKKILALSQICNAEPPNSEYPDAFCLPTWRPVRIAFIDKVAAPIANKMFECGMIP
jgi:hypothetical protein